MASRVRKYDFTVHSLLEAAGTGRSRAECPTKSETDHIVELQLVVAALKTLPSTTYTREGWETELVDFFNKNLNLQCMRRDENRQKGHAVQKFIQEDPSLTRHEKESVVSIKQHWNGIKRHLRNFAEFKEALDGILARV